MLSETEKKIEEMAQQVKQLKNLAHGISTIHARSSLGKKALTVERLAEVLWRETLDLKRELGLKVQLERTTDREEYP